MVTTASVVELVVSAHMMAGSGYWLAQLSVTTQQSAVSLTLGTMANPFSSAGPAPAPAPAIPARREKEAVQEAAEEAAPERTLLLKQACLVYKIPPQVSS